jgi:hypothetical protein
MGEQSSVGTRALIAFGMAALAIGIAVAIYSFDIGGGAATPDEALKEVVAHEQVPAGETE